MLRRNIIAFAMLALAIGSGVTVVAARAAAEPATATGSQAVTVTPTPVSGNASCASTCQAHHDQCRVQTKGSSSCDAERQRCLQACLQKKRQ